MFVRFSLVASSKLLAVLPPKVKRQTFFNNQVATGFSIVKDMAFVIQAWRAQLVAHWLDTVIRCNHGFESLARGVKHSISNLN